jgi:hypothetical protein
MNPNQFPNNPFIATPMRRKLLPSVKSYPAFFSGWNTTSSVYVADIVINPSYWSVFTSSIG